MLILLIKKGGFNKMRAKVRIDTVEDIARFVLTVEKVKEPVYLKNDRGLVVDGKSFLGVAHASEFKGLVCECERDIYSLIEAFIVTEDSISESIEV